MKKVITSASISSNEPVSFYTCLSLSKGIETNTFCFEHTNIPRDVESIAGKSRNKCGKKAYLFNYF